MGKSGNVYIVCAIDTEGPIDNPNKPDIFNSWDRVDRLIDEITSDEFRMRFPDSGNQGLVYSWFIIHLTGFKTNPFNRPMGYHAVYDHYLERYKKTMLKNNDGIYWHYHQPAPSGIGNEWCRDWTHCTEYHNILCHMILDRKFFPSCFRAGGRIEDDDLSNWIEEWIPFDYSNNSGDVDWNRVESDGKKLIDVCDWRRAPTEWAPYHPSKYDYQVEGDQKRLLLRCPDLASPVHTLSKKEIRNAFERASSGKNAVLAFFEHDRRDNVRAKIMEYACKQIYEVSKEYKNVKWYYENAKNAVVKALGLNKLIAPSFTAEVRQSDRIYIETKDKIFGTSPFTAALINHKYEEIPLHIIGENKWLSGHIQIKELDKIGVASNSPSGESGVNIFDFDRRTHTLVKRRN